MTDMTRLGLDPDIKPYDGEWTVIPPGPYDVVIIKDILTDNSAGTGKILKLTLQIINGQFHGELLKDTLNITNPNKLSQEIGQGTLRRICNICRVVYPPSNTVALHGKPIRIVVTTEEFISSTTGSKLKGNKIKKYNPVQSSEIIDTLAQNTNEDVSW